MLLIEKRTIRITGHVYTGRIHMDCLCRIRRTGSELGGPNVPADEIVSAYKYITIPCVRISGKIPHGIAGHIYPGGRVHGNRFCLIRGRGTELPCPKGPTRFAVLNNKGIPIPHVYLIGQLSVCTSCKVYVNPVGENPAQFFISRCSELAGPDLIPHCIVLANKDVVPSFIRLLYQ